MDREKARFLLTAYRTGGGDKDDPVFAEALAAVREDVELEEWFSQQQAFSRVLSGKLQEIAVPAEVKAKILAGSSASAGRGRPWRWWLSLAASVVISGLLVFWWFNRFVPTGPETMAAYRVDMGQYLSHVFFLDYESENVSDVRRWLKDRHDVTDYTIPESLDKYASLGCEVIRWHDLTAYLICFDVKGELVHLFLLPDGSHLPDSVSIGKTDLARVSGKWSTASWVEGDDLYLVSTLGSEEFLREALGRDEQVL